MARIGRRGLENGGKASRPGPGGDAVVVDPDRGIEGHHVHDRDDRVEHRDVDLLALAGAAAFVQCSSDADSREEAGRCVPDRGAHPVQITTKAALSDFL